MLNFNFVEFGIYRAAPRRNLILLGSWARTKIVSVIFDKAAKEACSGMCNLRPISEVALGSKKPTAGRKTFRMHNNL